MRPLLEFAWKAMKFFRPSWKDVCVFLFVWLMVGFSTGTSTLVGPVRWVTTLLRSSEEAAGAEKWVVRAIIVLYVMASAIIALWLTRVALRTPHRHVRFGI